MIKKQKVKKTFFGIQNFYHIIFQKRSHRFLSNLAKVKIPEGVLRISSDKMSEWGQISKPPKIPCCHPKNTWQILLPKKARNKKFQPPKNPSIIPVTWNPEHPDPSPPLLPLVILLLWKRWCQQNIHTKHKFNFRYVIALWLFRTCTTTKVMECQTQRGKSLKNGSEPP